jgi:hypothetical protein
MMRSAGNLTLAFSMLCAAATFLAPSPGAAEEKASKKAAAPAHAWKTGEVTLEGEVVVLECYLGSPEYGKGADHALCAKTCIAEGKPAGFLCRGDLYLLMEGSETPLKEMLPAVAGFPVRLTGNVIEQNGLHVIFAEKVERVGAAKS